MSDQVPHAERRESPRIAYRTVGFAVSHFESLDPDSVEVTTIWTENFGMGGVLVIAREELAGDKVLLKLLLPQLGDTLVECRIVHFGVREPAGPGPQQGVTYYYGMKFGNRLVENDLPKSVRRALAEAAEHHRSGKAAVPATRNEPVSPADSPSPLSQEALTVERLKGSEAFSEPERDSLIPFLSAIGLVVIYANYLIW